MADVTQALMRPKGGMDDVSDALGDQAQSSIISLFKASAPDGLDAWDKMTKMVPSIFNPGEITQNGGKFFSKGAIKELDDMMAMNKDLLVTKLFDDALITDKMDPGMLLAAKEEVSERMKLTLPHAMDSIVDINVLPVEGAKTSARFAEVTLGTPGGQHLTQQRRQQSPHGSSTVSPGPKYSSRALGICSRSRPASMKLPTPISTP